jgi:ABC-type phosphate transport system substrate-binding protein
MNSRFKGPMLAVAAAGTLAISRPVLAQDAGTDAPTTPSCDDTTMFPNPIYVTGSTAFQPVVQAMGAQLNSRTSKVTLLYHQGSGSCAGAAAVKDGTDLSGNAAYFVAATGASPTCTVPPGTKADIAISDVFYETCGFGARPANLADFPGPAQAMLLVVPGIAGNAVPPNITAEEAADVWGCGARANVTPWIVETAIQQRSAASGTQNVIARSINVLASSFHGTANTGTGNVINTLLNMDNDNALRPGTKVSIANPDTAIGFIAADAYDTTTNRARLRALAFRGFEQNQAYFADSASDTFDKRNVRDGHYLPWGYEHLLARVDSTGKPLTQAVQNFIDWVLGNSTTTENAPNFDPVQIETANHVIPTCAMSVQRKADGGFLSLYTPTDPCNCAFDTIIANHDVDGCMACTSDTTCAGGTHCHHGFCE